MPDEEQIDYKLFTVPTVVVQNLNIEAPAPPLELQELCKLPTVHLENLGLAMPPSTSAAAAAKPAKFPLETNVSSSPTALDRPKVLKVALEKLNLDPSLVQRCSSAGKVSKSLDVNFLKVPFVSLTRCNQTPPPVRRKVSFTLPPASELPSHNKLPIVDLTKYTIVGPHAHKSSHVPFRDCRVRVQRDDLLKLKSLVRKTEKPTFCKLCGKLYYSKKKLSYHQERKHDLVPSATEKKKRVSFSSTVTVHTMPYHRCRKCLKVFETYKILKSHMKLQHKKRNCYVCDYCDKPFADRTIFKIHIKLHCERCGELFPEKRELVRHRKTKCVVRRIRRVKCVTCAEVYFSNLALKDHSYSHTSPDKLICDRCKEPFSSTCPLIRHLHYSHGKSKSRSSAEKFTVAKTGSLRVYTCKFCACKFIDESDMRKHLETENSQFGEIEKKYGNHHCEYCPKKFKIEKNLLQHMWTHLQHTVAMEKLTSASSPVKFIVRSKDEKEEVLNGKTIERSAEPVRKTSEAKSSVVSTVGQVNGKVGERGKAMPVNGILNGDITVEKPKRRRMNLIQHKCPMCLKSFSCKSSLTRHQKLHVDFASLQCRVCEESFAWPSLLRDHRCLRDALPEMPFDDIRPEVPLVAPDNHIASTLGMDEELPATNDLSTQVDFDIPTPAFEFADVPVSPYAGCFAEEPCPALAGRAHRYRLLRQEVPIEF